MAAKENIKIRPEEAGERIDKTLGARYSEQSRSYFQSLIGQGMILLNGQPVKKRARPQIGDQVSITFAITPEIRLEPQNIDLSIVYEDEHLLIIDKPAGLVVHPGPKNWDGTVANALLYHFGTLSPEEDDLRPGIVHRLDKETSGLLMCAKTADAQRKLMLLFATRQIDKRYLAVTVGKPKEGLIDQPIGRHPQDRRIQIVRPDGKPSQTLIKLLAWDQKLALVECQLLTGRTHQIRVHLKHHGTPILGDSTYGIKRPGFNRQMLHALRLSFTHPFSKKVVQVQILPPDDMLPICSQLYPEILHTCDFSSKE
jgi:23S rRNA pseudouridine1911/1915/1917 synthase